MQTKRDYPEVGSVSHGTMREEDIIPDFIDVLREFDSDNPLIKEFDDIPDDDLESWYESEDCSFFLNEDLWDALNAIAPPYCYFGSHPGDGSDYGFWPCDDDETIREDCDGSESIETQECFAYESVESMEGKFVYQVNERGNATLYRIKNIELEEVWSVV